MSTQPAPVAAVNPTAATRRALTLPGPDRQALQLVADGLTARQIARRLNCSEHGVKNRLCRLYGRIGAHNAPHAVAIAIRAGLLPASDRTAAR